MDDLRDPDGDALFGDLLRAAWAGREDSVEVNAGGLEPIAGPPPSPSVRARALAAFDAEAGESVLAALLRAAEAGTEVADAPGPDVARVAAHFASGDGVGVGDEALLEDAARRPEVRALLAHTPCA